MINQFGERGIQIDKVYYCPFHPTAGVGQYKKDSFDRKPNPGMILQAKDEFNLDLSASILIGDKDSDIVAGESAGIRYNIKLLHRIDGQFESHFSSLRMITNWLKHI